MKTILINNKEYKVKEAKTKEEKIKGLQEVEKLPKNEGMIFYFDEPKKVSFTMKNTLIPLDIIFVDSEDLVVEVLQGLPNQEEELSCDKEVSYVIELNINSGVKVGNEVEFLDDPVMKVLSPDGSSLMDLWGGERIISRRETKILIKKAKKANESNLDSDYKSLGKYIFKVFKKLDSRDPEYVTAPN